VKSGAKASDEPVLLRYRRREVRQRDVALVESLASRVQTRSQLYRAVCEAWGWHRANGKASIQACQDLLLRLEERGHLRLPPGRRRAEPQRTLPLLPLDLIPLAGIEVRDPEADLSSLSVRPIEAEERLGWRIYMARYHYLGWRPIVGEHLLYAAFLGSELVALLGWAGAALQAPLRDAYLGWDEASKRRHLHQVANNIRFLVLPWVRVKHLASKVLAANLRRLSGDWQKAWGHRLWLAETFVDTRRFRGTCYRAANWRCLGQTAGRSRHANRYLRKGAPKALFVYPLGRRALEGLRAAAREA
jgi:Domain of unknown function (DUF4338)